MSDPRPSRTSATGIAISVVVLGLLAWLVLASPVFRIRTIEIAGNRTLDDASVLEIAGAARGESTVLLSTGELEAALEASPWIRQARVTRSFPSTLAIRVREREAVAMGTDPSGRFVVADDAVVLAREDGPLELPDLGTFPRALAPGDLLPTGSDVVRALAVLDAELRRRIETAVSEEGSLSLTLRDGGTIRFGDGNEIARKAAAAAAILDWADGRDIQIAYIDVSSPESPVLRPKGRSRELEPAIDAVP